MQVILGPMEGVLDYTMRELLTDLNDYDLCVTEFVRIVDKLLPDRVFTRLCPELKFGSQTRSGTPIRLQLLGQEPNWMAENAERAIALGSQGVDLNFGCPAKMVNKSRGGAALLQQPEMIYQIIKACREAVPKGHTLSAKIRLGWENPNDCFEILDAVEQAGADEVTVHARTKMGGYKANEIKWEYLSALQKKSCIPIIANGEIWNHADAHRCIEQTGISKLMVCRGAFNVPNLGNAIKYNTPHMAWSEVVQMMLKYSEYEIRGDKGLYYPNRMKQWLAYLRQEYTQADDLFLNIRKLNQAQPIIDYIQSIANCE